MNLNVRAVFVAVQKALPLLEAAATAEDPARVINISSIESISVPSLDTYAYSASKAAVTHMSRVLAGKLGPRQITVNAILPGPFQSRMMKQTIGKLQCFLNFRTKEEISSSNYIA